MTHVRTLVLPLALLACNPEGAPPVAPAAPVSSAARVGPTPPVETIDAVLQPLPGQTLRPTPFLSFTGATRMNTTPTPSRTAWRLEVDRAHTTAPALGPRLDAALNQGSAHAATITGDILDDAVSALEDFAAFLPGGSVVPHTDPERTTVYGYMPNRVRWATGGWVPQGWAGSVPLPDLRVDLDDPPMANDLRQRAARQYCSARQAWDRSNDNLMDMGKQSPFGLTILGQRIDFLTLEARVGLGGPQRFDAIAEGGSPDGGQAYMIPMTVNTRIYPIDAFGLPSLGDIAVPVSLVHADSELSTISDLGPIQTGGTTCRVVNFRLRCAPTTTDVHRRDYTTATHADAVLVGSTHSDVSVDIPFAYVGPIELRFVGSLDLDYGANRDTPARVSGGPGRVGWLNRNGSTGYAYHDGLWYGSEPAEAGLILQTGWAVRDAALPLPEFGDPWFIPVYQLPYYGQFGQTYAGAFQGDDHQVDVTSGLTLNLGVTGGLPDAPDFGLFNVTLTVSGSVTADVVQGFRVRQMLHAESWSDTGPAFPATSTTVEPFSRADATFNGIDATLRLTLNLLFRSIHITIRVPLAPEAPLASWNTDNRRVWPESSRLRMGTGGIGGLGFDMRTQPFVSSHNPRGADYLPFEDDLDACMALPPVPEDSPPPAACDPIPGQARDLPSTHLCAYAPVDRSAAPVPPLPLASVCASTQTRDAWIADAITQGEQDCRASMAQALCQGIALQQVYEGTRLIARNADQLDVGLLEDLNTMTDTCAAWYLGSNPSDSALQTFAEGMLGFGACDDDSRLQGAIASPIRRTDRNPPPIEDPEPCHF